MSGRDDGGPAFPRASGPEPRVNSATDYTDGMTLRDWYAGMALPACVQKCAGDDLPPNYTREQYFSMCAYRCADAMLAERAKSIPLSQQASAQRSIINAAGRVRAGSTVEVGRASDSALEVSVPAPAAPVCHNLTSNAQPCGNMKFDLNVWDRDKEFAGYRCAVCGLTEIRS